MIVRHYDREFEVELMDDGTLDTVVRVRPVSNTNAPWQEVRFSTEYAALYRNHPKGELRASGLRALGEEAAEEYDELTAYMETGWV